MASLVSIPLSDEAKSDRFGGRKGPQRQKSQKQSQRASGAQIQSGREEYTKSEKNPPLSFFTILSPPGESMGFYLTRLGEPLSGAPR